MTLVIAHGMPKSGSTFLYHVARDAIDSHNGTSHDEVRTRFLAGCDVPNFVPTVTDDLVAQVVARLPQDVLLAVKTHGALGPRTADLIGAGTVKAFSSFRDPRDTALSMLDARESDRRKGRTRKFFSSLRNIGDACSAAKLHAGTARAWLANPAVLRVPFYLIALEQDFVVSLVCEHLGLGSIRAAMQASFQAKRSAGTIPEFHAGIPDRFLVDVAAGDVAKLSKRLAPEVRELDAVAEETMSQHGFHSLWAQLTAAREARLKELAGAHWWLRAWTWGSTR